MSLLELARCRDEHAWQEMTDVYGPLVYHWGRKAGLSPEDSADLLQDVFRSVLTNLDRFKKQDSTDRFRAWLWTITRNKIRDFAKVGQNKIRATGGTNAYQHLVNFVSVVSSSDFDTSAGFQNFAELQRKLDEIKAGYKEVTWNAFWRVTVDERSAQCVADELKISVASVYQAKSRVLRRLRQEFEGLMELEL